MRRRTIRFNLESSDMAENTHEPRSEPRGGANEAGDLLLALEMQHELWADEAENPLIEVADVAAACQLAEASELAAIDAEERAASGGGAAATGHTPIFNQGNASTPTRRSFDAGHRASVSSSDGVTNRINDLILSSPHCDELSSSPDHGPGTFTFRPNPDSKPFVPSTGAGTGDRSNENQPRDPPELDQAEIQGNWMRMQRQNEPEDPSDAASTVFMYSTRSSTPTAVASETRFTPSTTRGPASEAGYGSETGQSGSFIEVSHPGRTPTSGSIDEDVWSRQGDFSDDETSIVQQPQPLRPRRTRPSDATLADSSNVEFTSGEDRENMHPDEWRNLQLAMLRSEGKLPDPGNNGLIECDDERYHVMGYPDSPASTIKAGDSYSCADDDEDLELLDLDAEDEDLPLTPTTGDDSKEAMQGIQTAPKLALGTASQALPQNVVARIVHYSYFPAVFSLTLTSRAMRDMTENFLTNKKCEYRDALIENYFTPMPPKSALQNVKTAYCDICLYLLPVRYFEACPVELCRRRVFGMDKNDDTIELKLKTGKEAGPVLCKDCEVRRLRKERQQPSNLYASNNIAPVWRESVKMQVKGYRGRLIYRDRSER